MLYCSFTLMSRFGTLLGGFAGFKKRCYSWYFLKSEKDDKTFYCTLPDVAAGLDIAGW
jgi:hypothetical protein